MTEREKMTLGQLYNPADDELCILRAKAHRLCQDFNKLYDTDEAGRCAILRELLPDFFVLPPERTALTPAFAVLVLLGFAGAANPPSSSSRNFSSAVFSLIYSVHPYCSALAPNYKSWRA